MRNIALSARMLAGLSLALFLPLAGAAELTALREITVADASGQRPCMSPSGTPPKQRLRC